VAGRKTSASKAGKTTARKSTKKARKPALAANAAPINTTPAAPRAEAFNPRDLYRGVIAIPLAEAIKAERAGKPAPSEIIKKGDRYSVIIDLDLGFPGGRECARQRVLDLLFRVLRVGRADDPDYLMIEEAVPFRLRKISPSYLFALLTADEIAELVRLDNHWPKTGKPRERIDMTLPSAKKPRPRAIFRIWPNHPVKPLLTKSVCTIKGDAAHAAFGASGLDIVWAVIDSGIDGAHPHFSTYNNLQLPEGVQHKDYTDAPKPAPLTDRFKHGTHVAGIIAGQFETKSKEKSARALTYVRDEHDNSTEQLEKITRICGVAPQAKLVSYKVLDDAGQGDVTRIIAALEDIARTNDDGRNIRIHGVNLSVGYPFDPRWFACGQSPLCSVVDRLVRSGVMVVAAAGNSGYGYVDTAFAGSWAQGLPLSINDPGNADRAFTVGSTHRDSPHRYGASYFSSKGPTGDGRLKPDVLAPGEKIISCNSRPDAPAKGAPTEPEYREESGTSMAAPHVSGAVAAFLSVRREFIGEAEEVKSIFMKSATDLSRDRYLQGTGLIDLLRALQSV
jgi:serine protease AprX